VGLLRESCLWQEPMDGLAGVLLFGIHRQANREHMHIPTPRRTLLAAGGLIPILAISGGCGSSTSSPDQGGAPVTTLATPSQPGQSPDLPPASTASGAPHTDWSTGTWHFKNAAGFSYDLMIGISDPMDKGAAQRRHPTDSTAVIGSACDIDNATDAVIPGYLEATATTQGFDTEISASFTFNHSTEQSPYDGHGVAPSNDDSRIEVEQYLSTGAECVDLSSTNSWGYGAPEPVTVHWSVPQADGASVTSAFTVIIHDFYSPATPSGDSDLLRWLTIRPLWSGWADDHPGSASTFSDTELTDSLPVYSPRGLPLAGPQRASVSVVRPGKLTICQLVDGSPYARRAPSGHVEGYEIDVMGAVAKELGVKPAFVSTGSFDTLMTGTPLIQRSCDILSGQISPTPERARDMLFSDAYHGDEAFSVRLGNTALLAAVNNIVGNPQLMTSFATKWFS
jgi:hypothetical protein